jgi:hypothetical protein
MNQIWEDVCNLLDITQHPTIAFRPQGNGQVERINQTIGELLRRIATSDNKWDTALPIVEMAINNAPIGNGKHSPFYLNYGFNPTMPADLYFKPDTYVETEPVKNLAIRMANIFHESQEYFAKHQELIANQYNQHRRQPLSYPINSFVYVRTSTRPAFTAHTSKHFRLPWTGPFRVKGKINDVIYELDIPQHPQMDPTFHVESLRLHIPPYPSQIEPTHPSLIPTSTISSTTSSNSPLTITTLPGTSVDIPSTTIVTSTTTTTTLGPPSITTSLQVNPPTSSVTSSTLDPIEIDITVMG